MEFVQLVFTLFSLVIIVGAGFFLLTRFQPQRVKALNELAQRKDWQFQSIGGLPRSALQLTFASVNPAELRQHGRCITGENEKFRFYSCDASYVDMQISTQTIVLVIPKELDAETPKDPDAWHLLLGKRRQLDQFDQVAQHTLEHLDTKLGMAYRSDQLHKAQLAIPFVKPFAEKKIQIEWLQKHLILYKPNHILEPEFIEQVIEQATDLYEKLETI